MTTESESPLTSSDLARLVIEKEKKALTVDGIWALAEQTGLVPQLKGTGKTPKATLGARLYTDAKAEANTVGRRSQRIPYTSAA